METLESQTSSQELVCWKVWGGNERTKTDLSIPGFEGALYSSPYKSTKGGDLYYMSACGSGAISRFCLADVSGHGEAMAPVSEWFEKAFSKQIHLENSSQVLTAVNKKAVSGSFKGFSTAICASYNSLNGDFHYCYAGHPNIRICRNGDHHWEELIAPTPDSTDIWNLPLGVLAETQFSLGRTKLNPGDRLALFSDGLIEARNDLEELIGDAIWNGPVTSPTASSQMNEILGMVQEHVGVDREPDDDVTLIVFDVKPYQQGNKYSLLFRNNIWNKIKNFRSRSNRSNALVPRK